jgi:hypothetical protein
MADNAMPAAKEVNHALLDMFDKGLQKEAREVVTDFVRMKMREEGFMRQIIPPVQVTDDDLDKQVQTDKPVIICEREPDSPPAYSVPFGTLPNNRYIRGNKFRVMFQRLMTPRFLKDINELRTYDQDIRQIISDNALKDMQAEEDGKFIATVESICVGANQIVPFTGVAQWTTIADALTRESWNDALKTLPRTPAHFSASTVLMNNVTVLEFQKWGRDETGGDLAQQVALNGWGQTNWFGVRVLVTIKRNLVPDGRIYQFVVPKALGKFFLLEDVTMYVDTKAFMIEFFAYSSIGAAIANSAGVAITDFTGSQS